MKHYIPPHTITTGTTKLRAVYDASADRDPMILADLCGLLPRFKIKRNGIISGIEKVFPQDGIQQLDRDVTKFL